MYLGPGQINIQNLIDYFRLATKTNRANFANMHKMSTNIH